MKRLLRWILAGTVVLGLGLAGGVAWFYHVDTTPSAIEAFEGTNPRLEDPAPQTIPTTGLVRTLGWAANAAPQPASGLVVSRFADGLAHPRTMLVLPNGDVLITETNAPQGSRPGGIIGFFQSVFLRRVGADDVSPDRIVLLRDSKGTGHADQRFTLRHDDLHSPSGMAYADGHLYVANDNAVLVFDYRPGDTVLAGKPVKIADLPGGGHWMRNLLLSPDDKQLYVAVGSATNIADGGLEQEKGRAGIWQIDLGHIGPHHYPRQYAGGMRNPNGMGWNPSTGELWTVVNERDMLGPNLVPDYLTNVPVGAHYGWPWVYWKNVVDDRVNAPMPEYLTDYTRKPEYALGPHVAPLGMAFAQGGARLGPAFANGVFIARHGSWNRRAPVGYDVVFVAFDARGNPQGLPVPVLTGFLTGQGTAHGRPVWLGFARDGALLVTDDTGGVVWRVIAPGAAPSPPPRPAVGGVMPPRRSLSSPEEPQAP